MRQFVVAVEGLDGSGKSSLISLLTRSLNERGVSVHFGDWFRDKEIQRLAMLFNSHDLMTPEILAALHGASTIFQAKEARASGCNVVVWDRYIYSSFASCVNRGASRELLRAIVRSTPAPDLTLLLVEDPQVCYDRIVTRKGLRFFESNIDRLYRGRIAEALKAFQGGEIPEPLLREVFINSGREWYGAVREVIDGTEVKLLERFNLEEAGPVIQHVLNCYEKSLSPS